MEKHQLFKRFLACSLVVIMALTSAPLSGFVGLELPAWSALFATKASAATEGYLAYEVEDGEAKITDCDTSISGELVIPDTLGGYPVKSIGDEAFYNCTGLTKINWNAENVNDFPYGSTIFYNAGTSGSGIDVVFGDNVKRIPANAFYISDSSYSPKIKSVTIGNSVTSIGDHAFNSCTGLTSVTIGNSVTSIGFCAFCDCTGLTNITIPDSVTSIGGSAFYNTAWYKAKPDGDVYVGKFYYRYKGVMPKNTSIVIQDGTKGIADSAFYNCTGLTSVTIPETVTSIGTFAFDSCAGLTSVTIGNGVTSIGNWAFADCTGLTSVTIPNSVISIGELAFYNCTGLTSVTIGNSVTSIGDSAFYGCTGLTKINWNAESVSYSDYRANVFCNAGTAGDGIDVVFGDNVKSIPKAAFYVPNSLYRPKITSVTIGNSVTSIGYNAFYNCTGLTSVTIPNSVTSIDDFAFYNCTGLTSITIPGSVTSIGDSAFRGCTGLTSVTIGNSVTSIGDNVFGGCSGLETVKFTGKPPAFSGDTFYRCWSTVLYPYGISEWKSAIKSDYGGNIKWIPYSKGSLVKLKINSLPKKTIYEQYETADYTGLSLSATWSDGLTEVVTPYSNIYDITFSGFSTETPGLKTVTATYGGKSVQFEIGVHKTSVFTEEKEKYPESTHNYADNLNETKTYKCPDAVKLVVTFSNDTFVEKDGDYIYVNGIKYTGDELAGKTLTINGDTLTVKLVSDSYGNFYGYSIDKIEVTKVEHEKEKLEAVEPTCTTAGKTEGEKCMVCGKVITAQQSISATGHTVVIDKVIAATCTSSGITEGKHCSVCDTVLISQQIVPATGHKNKTTTIPATTSADGQTVTACSVCGEVLSTAKIYKASSIKLSKTSYTYNGKVQKPTVTVKNSKGRTLKNGTDYTVSYASGCKNTGKYAVKITFKGNYSGTKTLYFNILPSKTTKLSASQTTTSVKATWKAVTGATGYKVTLYNSKGKAVKTVYTTKTTASFTKLSKGTTYKVRVTAYKTIDGKKVASSDYTQLTTATKPGTPSLKVTAGTKKASLSWSKQTGASGYVVYMATSKNGTYKKIATVKGSTKVSYTKTGLTKGKTYYFKVKAYTSVDGQTISGGYSAVKYAKIK